jgi:hypothetical protein
LPEQASQVLVLREQEVSLVPVLVQEQASLEQVSQEQASISIQISLKVNKLDGICLVTFQSCAIFGLSPPT